MLVMAIADLRMLLRTADIAAAMSVEGQLGTDRVFAPELQAIRPHPGQALSAANLTALMADSGDRRLAPHRRLQPRPGRLLAALLAAGPRRCARHGGVRRNGGRPRAGSAVDNPVVVGDHVESNGNFHGAPVAYVLDFLAIVAADVASISERRTDRFLDKTRSHGLNPFLAADPGVDRGQMIAQYTQAAIVSELKRLANPASVDSIPSSAMQEDHVSMGWSAARKLRRSVDGLTRVVAIEVMTAARALDMRGPRPVAGDRGGGPHPARRRRPGPRPRPAPLARDRDGRLARRLRCGPRRRRVRDRRARMSPKRSSARRLPNGSITATGSAWPRCVSPDFRGEYRHDGLSFDRAVVGRLQRRLPRPGALRDRGPRGRRRSRRTPLPCLTTTTWPSTPPPS